MNLKPSDLTDLANLLADAHARGQKILSFDLSMLNRLLEHTAEDMTAKVEAGMSLTELQEHLARRGQWLPVDPPNPEALSIGSLLASDASGPRRFGCGTVRDYLIGITVVLADGRIIHSGGNVVKNVAGYDLMKLFIGSHGSLAVIVEAVFKLRPLPQAEKFVEVKCESLDQAGSLIESVLSSALSPVVFDWHHVSPSTRHSSLVLGFAGTVEELEWQLARASELGFNQPSSLDYSDKLGAETGSTHKLSVLPSKLIEVVRGLNGAPFIARVGNGIIYHGGPSIPNHAQVPSKLGQRLKDEFDPKHILPNLPA